MYPYPSIFPAEEVRVLLPILRGEAPPASTATHAAWVVVGYGASQILPDGPQPMGAAPLTESACADCLEQASRAPVGAVADHLDAIPWGQIVLLLLELASRWLKK